MLAPVLATAVGLSVCHKSKLSKRLNESSWFWHGSIIPPIRHCVKRKFGYLHTHTHPFNGPLSGTTRVSRYQKGKTNLDFTGARDSEWQWNQLDHMQVCTLLQTDNHANKYTHTHTRLTALFPGLPRWAGTRKVKPIWILLKQETVSGSGIRWAICKSAPCSRQITKPAPHHSVFYRPDALPAAQPTASKHWRQLRHANK